MELESFNNRSEHLFWKDASLNTLAVVLEGCISHSISI